MTELATITVRYTSSQTALYHWYDGESEPQPTHIGLGLRDAVLYAGYDGEIGNAVPTTVAHGFDRRYSIPLLTGTAADALLDEIAPLAARVVAGWEQVWDGANMTVRLDADATAAEEEIIERLGSDLDPDDQQQLYDASDLIDIEDDDEEE